MLQWRVQKACSRFVWRELVVWLPLGVRFWRWIEVCNCRHDAFDYGPREGRAVEATRLVHNGTDALGSDNGPDEEGDACSGDKIGFDGEEVADLVHRKPQGRQRACPKEEE